MVEVVEGPPGKYSLVWGGESPDPDDTRLAALRIVIALCGGRWVYPPVRMTDTYPVPSTGRISVSGRPVRKVFSVTRSDGDVVDPDDVILYNDHIVAIPVSGCKPAHVDIDYEYGLTELPIIVRGAIAALAREMQLADEGSAECRIPERVTSVTRQGMSWTMIDPMDFMDKGRTGIYEVDLAINSVRPARRRARIFHPTTSAVALRRPS